MKEMIFRTSDDGLVMNSASEIELVRCKDCVNFVWDSISQNAGSCGIGIGDGRHNWHSKDWFCANGVAKDINVPDKESW